MPNRLISRERKNEKINDVTVVFFLLINANFSCTNISHIKLLVLPESFVHQYCWAMGSPTNLHTHTHSHKKRKWKYFRYIPEKKRHHNIGHRSISFSFLPRSSLSYSPSFLLQLLYGKHGPSMLGIHIIRGNGAINIYFWAAGLTILNDSTCRFDGIFPFLCTATVAIVIATRK